MKNYQHKYRKKADVVEARQFKGGLKNAVKMMKWLERAKIAASYRPKFVINGHNSHEELILGAEDGRNVGMIPGEWIVFRAGRLDFAAPSKSVRDGRVVELMLDHEFRSEFVDYTP